MLVLQCSWVALIPASSDCPKSQLIAPAYYCQTCLLLTKSASLCRGPYLQIPSPNDSDQIHSVLQNLIHRRVLRFLRSQMCYFQFWLGCCWELQRCLAFLHSFDPHQMGWTGQPDQDSWNWSPDSNRGHRNHYLYFLRYVMLPLVLNRSWLAVEAANVIVLLLRGWMSFVAAVCLT